VTTHVAVAILHPEATGAGPLEAAVSAARARLAERHRHGFAAAGADAATVISGSNGRTFGERLASIAGGLDDADGLVVLGSGAVPLLTAADRRRFVGAARDPGGRGLTNNRYSADIVAIPDARAALDGLPAMATDNALPRWLDETAGRPIDDLRDRWRLGVDIDGPLDLLLLGGRWAASIPTAWREPVTERRARLRAVAANPRAEVLLAGRTSAAALAWLERATAARTRALIEERGLRTRTAGQRPAASVLGALLERDGPETLGRHLASLSDGAIVDSRVLLAHHAGADEAGWPPAEDRFASDLLLHERVADPWLRALTRAAAEAPIPVLLGGHTLVGPGLRLALSARA
jgi:hypothetical protein